MSKVKRSVKLRWADVFVYSISSYVCSATPFFICPNRILCAHNIIIFVDLSDFRLIHFNKHWKTYLFISFFPLALSVPCLQYELVQFENFSEVEFGVRRNCKGHKTKMKDEADDERKRTNGWKQNSPNSTIMHFQILH